MISPTPSFRSFARVAALTSALLLLAGCTPTPAPSPTPTPAFASEEEAFAAAEATYRAYNDALNQVDPANPETFDATYRYTMGDFKDSDRENFTNMHAEHHSIQGDALVTKFFGTSTDQFRQRIDGTICVDVSGVDIVDTDGKSVVNPERPDVYAIEVRFKVSDGRVLIDQASRAENKACVAS